MKKGILAVLLVIGLCVGTASPRHRNAAPGPLREKRPRLPLASVGMTPDSEVIHMPGKWEQPDKYPGVGTRLKSQSNRELRLYHARHEIVEKSSKIVS